MFGRRMILILMMAVLLLPAVPAGAGWNPVDVAADGKGIAVYTTSSGGKQAGILYNGYSDDLSLQDTNGLYSCTLTTDYTVWLNQSMAEKNQPQGEGIQWYSAEWDALMPCSIFVAEVVQQDAPLYTTPGHKHLSEKHAMGTLVKVCGEFGNDYFVCTAATSNTRMGFMPKAALRKVQDMTYVQANYEIEYWGLPDTREMTIYTGGTPLALGGSATGYSDLSPEVVKDGQRVVVLKMLENWAQLANGCFVEARFLVPDGDHSVTYATVKTTSAASRLNVRSYAGSDWVTAKLCSGVQVQVPAHTDEWASVFITGPKGGDSWSGSVQIRYLAFGTAAEKVKNSCIRVKTTEMLYGDYTGNAGIVKDSFNHRTLPAGTEMTVIGVHSGYDVNQDDDDLFLCLLDDGTAITVQNEGGVLEPLESLGVTAKAASSVRMREKPSTEAQTICTLSKGTKVEVLLRGEGWTIVKYKEQTGYIMSRYLNFP